MRQRRRAEAVRALAALGAADGRADASRPGIPAGLVNVVTGAGPTGALLCAHPGIDGISFTGSVPTGRKVATAAAATFKNVVLELGGKAPNVVFADADLDAAVRGCVWGVFNNSGQACVATTRLLVERPVLDAVVERLVALTGRLRIGDPLDPIHAPRPARIGRAVERVQGYLELAAEERATRLTGGGAVPERGFFVDPTVLVDVEPEMRIAREEIFGPVLAVLPFDGEDEAVELANGVDFGLSANIWTRDVGRMLRMAERLDVGDDLGQHGPPAPSGAAVRRLQGQRPRQRLRRGRDRGQHAAQARLDPLRRGPQRAPSGTTVDGPAGPTSSSSAPGTRR